MIEFDDEICEIEFTTSKEKKRFLANLMQIPYTSIIGDDKRLLNEIETWMNI